jgi:type I restriction enzyme S subunit
VKIPYPKPSEQIRIATVLSCFDELIENKKRQKDILEATASAIFKNWFVDFEPFKDGGFVESELGEIPVGWDIRPIGELADVRNGSSYTGEEKFEDQVEGSHIFITLNNAIEGGGFKPVYAWIKSDRLKEYHFLEEGDLIIPNTEQTKDERLLGSPGIVFFPPEYVDKKGVYSHHITKISPHSEEYKLFLYFLLRFTRENSASFATGTGVLGMDIENFRKNKLVIVPPSRVIRRFRSIIEPLVQKVIVNQKQIMILRRVRDDLLPLLVFGKLRVEEV